MSMGPNTQTAILRLIQADPGIHKSRIQRRLRIGWGTVCFHTDRLLADQVIHAVRAGARLHLFSGALPNDLARRSVAIHQQHARTILQALQTRPNASISSLARATGAARRTVRTRLQALQSVGIVHACDTPQIRYALDMEAAREAQALTDNRNQDTAPSARPISLA